MTSQDNHGRLRDIGVAGLLVTALLVATAAVAAAADGPGGSELEGAVERRLLLDPVSNLRGIEAASARGIVTLSGEVGSLYARDRALDVARATRGVRAVVDQIEVAAPRRPDGRLRQEVEAALINDPATESYQLDVRVEDGVVTLSGTVDSHAERDLAEQVARRVGGVKDTVSKIALRPHRRRPDAEIAEDVRARLAADERVNASLVHETVRDGVVQLAGVVGSAAERSRVALMAWVAGVKRVDASRVKVDPATRTGTARTRRVDPEPAAIRRSLQAALEIAPRTAPFELHVAVKGHQATLSGAVDNLAAARTARRIARHTVGVWRVRNNIVVRPTRVMKDRQLEQRVRRALDRDPLVHRHAVSLFAINGKIYLQGDVASHVLRRHIDAVVSRVRGVIAISNNLRVKPTPAPFGDAALKKRVDTELFWAADVDSRGIEVRASDGVVTLRGRVGSWYELRSASREARQAGAVQVRNLLQVQGWDRTAADATSTAGK